MDSRCPHCKNELSFSLLSGFRKKGQVLAGDQAWSCPHCQEPVAFNPLPPEADLPFRLTGEFAIFTIFAIAWLIAQLLSPAFPTFATTGVLFLAGLFVLTIQQWHLYTVRLKLFPVYRVAKVSEVSQSNASP